MSGPHHVLVVDDDPAIRQGVARLLTAHGLRVTVAADGPAMRRAMQQVRVDLVLLDVMLPGQGGLDLLQALRAEGGAPVLMLSALGGETDRVLGLELGAEDYVCKPFSPRELVARVRVALRRGAASDQRRHGPAVGCYRFEGWVLDARARTLASPTGAHVELTSGEFELLLAFVEHPNRMLTRDQLLDLARGRASQAIDRAVDVQVMRLRRKIEAEPAAPVFIKTVRNGGYIFTPLVERDAAHG
jgi:two-component system OmpR family response regulator